jgi:hypothetical protein
MPAIKVVYAVATCASSTDDGIGVNLREGDVWAADDPFVRSHPGLFSDEPPGPRFPLRTVRVVEQATAAPGERRVTRRA